MFFANTSHLSNDNRSVRELKNIYRRKSNDLDHIKRVLEDMNDYSDNFRVHFSDAEDDVEDVFVLEYILCKTRKLELPLVVLSRIRCVTDTGKRDCMNLQVTTSKKGVLEIKLLIESLLPYFRSLLIDRFAIQNAIFRGKTEHLKFLLNTGKGKEFLWKGLYLFHDEVIPNEIAKYIFKWAHMDVPPKNARRILLCADFLYAARTVEEDNADENVRIVWRSIPDPFLTFNEIYQLFVNTSTFLQRWTKMGAIKSTLLSLSLSGQAPYSLHLPPTPRSLAHYCRCTIRGRLKENCELPVGIYSFGLPQRLVDYLKLEF